jgi:hypothetical protein
MSSNFIRRYRARCDYASVPPARARLSTRALAPKSVSPTRTPSTVTAIQASITRNRPARRVPEGRQAGSRVTRIPLQTEFDIAFIPVPVSGKNRPVSMLIYCSSLLSPSL